MPRRLHARCDISGHSNRHAAARPFGYYNFVIRSSHPTLLSVRGSGVFTTPHPVGALGLTVAAERYFAMSLRGVAQTPTRRMAATRNLTPPRSRPLPTSRIGFVVTRHGRARPSLRRRGATRPETPRFRVSRAPHFPLARNRLRTPERWPSPSTPRADPSRFTRALLRMSCR